MAAPIFKPFAVVIKNHHEPTYSLRLVIESSDITIGKLKTLIEQKHKGNPLIQDQLLVYRGKLLESKTNLFTLFQSSIIDTKSPPNTMDSGQDMVSSMYIHMTLRGGSDTASKIGLICKAEDIISNNKENKASKSDSDLLQNTDKTAITTTTTTTTVTNEEEKYPLQRKEISTSCQAAQESLPERIPRQISEPLHGHHHHVNPFGYYGYPLPPPPPPNPFYFSQSMPDLMQIPYTIHRQHSAPSNPSMAFAPPTLVRQTSNPDNNIQKTHHPHPAHPHHPHHPHPHHHHHPHPHHHHHHHSMRPPPPPPPPPHHHGYYGYHHQHYPPSSTAPYGYHSDAHHGIHSYSTSDLRSLRDSPYIAQSVDSMKYSKSKPILSDKIDEKEEGKHDDDINNNNNNNNNNNIPNIGEYGLRQRRGRNVDNNNNNNNNNNDENAAPNNIGNNVFVNNANNANNVNVVVRESFFARLFRILNINTLIRLAIFMWLFGPNLGTYRFTMLCIAAGFYYLHQIGILHRIFGGFIGNRNNRNNMNEPRHRDPNVDDNNNNNIEPPQIPPTPLNYVQLLQRFLIGLFASLWPTWDHRNLYPPIPQ